MAFRRPGRVGSARQFCERSEPYQSDESPPQARAARRHAPERVAVSAERKSSRNGVWGSKCDRRSVVTAAGDVLTMLRTRDSTQRAPLSSA